MDTPYNRRVPLPSRFRRQQKKRSPIDSLEPTYRSVIWLLCAAICVLACFITHKYELSTTVGIPHVNRNRPHYSIISDVEEARNTLLSTRNQLAETGLETTLSTLAATVNGSADTLSSAESFVLCHDKLVLDITRWDRLYPTCDALFEQLLTCQYRYTRYHEHHKRLITACGIHVVEGIEEEIGRHIEREDDSVVMRSNEQVSFLTSWFRWMGARVVYKAQEGVQRGGNHDGGAVSAPSRSELRDSSDQIKNLRIFDPHLEPYRQDVRIVYGRVLQPFVDMGCGQPGFICSCEDIDLELVRRAYREAALGVERLKSSMSGATH